MKFASCFNRYFGHHYNISLLVCTTPKAGALPTALHPVIQFIYPAGRILPNQAHYHFRCTRIFCCYSIGGVFKLHTGETVPERYLNQYSTERPESKYASACCGLPAEASRVDPRIGAQEFIKWKTAGNGPEEYAGQKRQANVQYYTQDAGEMQSKSERWA